MTDIFLIGVNSPAVTRQQRAQAASSALQPDPESIIDCRKYFPLSRHQPAVCRVWAKQVPERGLVPCHQPSHLPSYLRMGGGRACLVTIVRGIQYV